MVVLWVSRNKWEQDCFLVAHERDIPGRCYAGRKSSVAQAGSVCDKDGRKSSVAHADSVCGQRRAAPCSSACDT